MTKEYQIRKQYDNTERLLFSGNMPSVESVEIPNWVNKKFDKTRIVPLFPY